MLQREFEEEIEKTKKNPKSSAKTGIVQEIFLKFFALTIIFEALQVNKIS